MGLDGLDWMDWIGWILFRSLVQLEHLADSAKDKKKMAISKMSSEERAARAARRSLAKEAPTTTKPRVRFLKLGNLAAQPRRKEAVIDVAIGGSSEVTCCIRKC